MRNEIADTLQEIFQSVNESDGNGEAANVVDGLFAISRAILKLADAVEQHGSDIGKCTLEAGDKILCGLGEIAQKDS